MEKLLMQKINGISFPNIDVSTPAMIQKSELVALQGFQLDNLREAMKYVTNWSIAIDGGANIGTWTNELSNHFEEVYSFELAPDTFECLQENIMHWDISSSVHAWNKAISSVITTVGVDEGKNKNPRSGGRHISKDGDIPTVTIDSLNLSDLGFLKLDLEGHEADGLIGAIQTLEQFHPVVLIENKPKLASRYGNISAVNILENMGAKLVNKVGNNQMDWIFVW